MSDLADIEVKHQPEQNRYALLFDGAVKGEATYELDGKLFRATHTVIDPALRGRGLGDILVSAMVHDLRTNTDYTIVPLCSFVADWFYRHPEEEDLLEPR